MQKNLTLIGFITLILVGIAAFFWFELRPVQIKKECIQRVYYQCNITNDPNQCKGSELTTRTYELCLHESGI